MSPNRDSQTLPHISGLVVRVSDSSRLTSGNAGPATHSELKSMSLLGRDSNSLKLYSDVSAIRSMAENPSELAERGNTFSEQNRRSSTKECSYNVTWIRKRIKVFSCVHAVL